MAISIDSSSLVSNVVRSNIGNNGVRAIDTSLELVESDQGLLSSIGNFVSGIIGQRATNFLSRGAGFIVSKVTAALSWTFSGLFSWGLQGVLRLIQFDWNTTDAEIAARWEADKQILASVWGSTAGSALGWLAGIGLGYGISVSLPVIGSKFLAAKVTKAVLEEATEEVLAQVEGAVRVSLGLFANNLVRLSFVGWRRLIQLGQVGFTGALFGQPAAEELIGQIVDGYSWGGDKAPEWSFSKSGESLTGKLTGLTRIFVDSALDEFSDALIEAGFIVAGALDAHVAEEAREQERNPERGLVLYPDRDNSNESIILTGTQQEIQAEAQSALTQHRLIGSRDVGDIAAVPMQEIITPNTSRRTLTLKYNSFDKPPYVRRGERGVRVTLNIPDAKPGISFNELTSILRPFNRGGIRATARLNNGRQLAVYGVTSTECDEVIRALLRFTTAEVIRTVYSDVNSGVAAWQKKDIALVHPVEAYMTTRVVSPTAATVINKSEKMELWRGEALGISFFP